MIWHVGAQALKRIMSVFIRHGKQVWISGVNWLQGFDSRVKRAGKFGVLSPFLPARFFFLLF
jgi:hypothetical protein